jgi:2-phosphosulfolactate phosphatase
MDIEILHLIEGAKRAEGLTVVIDVFRAFSTACYVIRNGAKEIIPVGDIRLAYQLKKENPNVILMGERGGKIQPGFDYGNSPSQIESVNFSGRTIIQTTSAGTQGFANAQKADALITGSFVNAGAIVSYIRFASPQKLSLVCMGSEAREPSEEDTLCAEYIRASLSGKKIDVEPILEQIRNCASARKFFDPAKQWAPRRDFDLCLNISHCGFVLRAEAFRDRLVTLKPVYTGNHPY